MAALIKQSLGATRVCIFDHTVRESGKTNLNAQDGGSAAPVPRVHCDYTADGAPRRLAQLAKAGALSDGQPMSDDAVAALTSRRFAFINVWRSIADDGPVRANPLAVCDEHSVSAAERFIYELRFADRTGENYSLRFSERHKW